MTPFRRSSKSRTGTWRTQQCGCGFSTAKKKKKKIASCGVFAKFAPVKVSRSTQATPTNGVASADTMQNHNVLMDWQRSGDTANILEWTPIKPQRERLDSMGGLRMSTAQFTLLFQIK